MLRRFIVAVACVFAATGAIAQGADFATLAAEQSIEPTARDGGFLGTVDPATLRPERAAASRSAASSSLRRYTWVFSIYVNLCPLLTHVKPPRFRC